MKSTCNLRDYFSKVQLFLYLFMSYRKKKKDRVTNGLRISITLCIFVPDISQHRISATDYKQFTSGIIFLSALIMLYLNDLPRLIYGCLSVYKAVHLNKTDVKTRIFMTKGRPFLIIKTLSY